jgi:hypothetical protein
VEILAKLLSWIGKPSPRLLGAIMMFCGISLWLFRFPWFADWTKDTLGSHKGWLVIGLLASLAWLLTYPIEFAGKRVQKAIKQKSAIKRRIARLHDLTNEQKRVLSEYIGRRSKSATWAMPSGIIASLAEDGIIYAATRIGDMDAYPYNISEDAWKYLNEHPELLQTSNR